MSDVLSHWNDRAALGPCAGTQDRGLVALEQRVIQAHVRPGLRVLDVGCGVGETLTTLSGVERVGMDFSPAMIAQATASHPEIRFEEGDIRYDLSRLGLFDLIYTQRCLINLLDQEAQGAAVRRICQQLTPGGCYLAVEHSADGLVALNGLRQQVGLSAIIPPWHNCYLQEDAVRAFVADPTIDLTADAEDFSSTYYFLSRVVNAWLAQREGRDPSYEAPINALALQLPVFGDVGQARYWRWRRLV